MRAALCIVLAIALTGELGLVGSVFDNPSDPLAADLESERVVISATSVLYQFAYVLPCTATRSLDILIVGAPIMAGGFTLQVEKSNGDEVVVFRNAASNEVGEILFFDACLEVCAADNVDWQVAYVPGALAITNGTGSPASPPTSLLVEFDLRLRDSTHCGYPDPCRAKWTLRYNEWKWVPSMIIHAPSKGLGETSTSSAEGWVLWGFGNSIQQTRTKAFSLATQDGQTKGSYEFLGVAYYEDENDCVPDRVKFTEYEHHRELIVKDLKGYSVTSDDDDVESFSWMGAHGWAESIRVNHSWRGEDLVITVQVGQPTDFCTISKANEEHTWGAAFSIGLGMGALSIGGDVAWQGVSEGEVSYTYCYGVGSYSVDELGDGSDLARALKARTIS